MNLMTTAAVPHVCEPAAVVRELRHSLGKLSGQQRVGLGASFQWQHPQVISAACTGSLVNQVLPIRGPAHVVLVLIVYQQWLRLPGTVRLRYPDLILVGASSSVGPKRDTSPVRGPGCHPIPGRVRRDPRSNPACQFNYPNIA